MLQLTLLCLKKETISGYRTRSRHKKTKWTCSWKTWKGNIISETYEKMEGLILNEYLKNRMYGHRVNSSASGQDPPVEKMHRNSLLS